MKVINKIEGFHHQLHSYRDYLIMLSKDGGFKILNSKLSVKYSEDLAGKLLSYSFLHDGFLYASTTDTFLYSFDIEKLNIIENGSINLYFNSKSKNQNLILAKSIEHVDQKKVKNVGLFDLDSKKFIFTKAQKTGRIFDLIDQTILFAGIGTDYAISTMDLNGNELWNIDLRKVTNEEEINSVKVVGRYLNSILFAALSNSRNHLIGIDILTGEPTKTITSSVQNPLITNYHTSIVGNLAVTVQNDTIIYLNLDTWQISIKNIDIMNAEQSILEEDKLLFFGNRTNQIGEIDLNNSNIKWIKNIELGNDLKIRSIRSIGNTIFFSDSNDTLYQLEY